MRHDDLHELAKALRSVSVSLPTHQQQLRRHVLELPARERGFVCPVLALLRKISRAERHPITCLKIVSVGVAVVLAALTFGLVLLLQDSPNSRAQKLIAEATQKINDRPAMPAGDDTVAATDVTGPDTNEADEYKDLGACLQAAQESQDAQVVDPQQINPLIDSEHQPDPVTSNAVQSQPATYITYTNDEDHTVAIALDDNKTPLFAVDIDVTAALDAPKIPPGQQKKSGQAASHIPPGQARKALGIEQNL